MLFSINTKERNLFLWLQGQKDAALDAMCLSETRLSVQCCTVVGSSTSLVTPQAKMLSFCYFPKRTFCVLFSLA